MKKKNKDYGLNIKNEKEVTASAMAWMKEQGKAWKKMGGKDSAPTVSPNRKMY